MKSRWQNQAEILGHMALTMGFMPSFIVRHFPDSWEFYILDETAHQLLPEEAYLHLTQLVEQLTRTKLQR